MDFADKFDVASTDKRDMENIRKQNIPLSMLTDSRSLLYILTKSYINNGKWLITGLRTVKVA